MKPTMRKYQKAEDYWCIREFLREVGYRYTAQSWFRGFSPLSPARWAL